MLVPFQNIVDLVDSDSSIDDAEDVEEFEDVPETYNVEDDVFTDDIRTTKIERLSGYMYYDIKIFPFCQINII